MIRQSFLIEDINSFPGTPEHSLKFKGLSSYDCGKSVTDLVYKVKDSTSLEMFQNCVWKKNGGKCFKTVLVTTISLYTVPTLWNFKFNFILKNSFWGHTMLSAQN